MGESDHGGGTRIVRGDNGDIGKIVWPRVVRMLPAIITTAVLAILAQGFLMWREQAVTNSTMRQLQIDFSKHTDYAEENYLKKDEWLRMKAEQDKALMNGLAGIERELGYIANRQTKVLDRTEDVLDRTAHNQSILEKLPVQKEKQR